MQIFSLRISPKMRRLFSVLIALILVLSQSIFATDSANAAITETREVVNVDFTTASIASSTITNASVNKLADITVAGTPLGIGTANGLTFANTTTSTGQYLTGNLGNTALLGKIQIDVVAKFPDGGCAAQTNGSMLFGLGKAGTYSSYNIYRHSNFIGFNTFNSDIYGVPVPDNVNYHTYKFVMLPNSSAQNLQEIWVDGVKQTLIQKTTSTGTSSCSAIRGVSENASARIFTGTDGSFMVMSHPLGAGTWATTGSLKNIKITTTNTYTEPGAPTIGSITAGSGQLSIPFTAPTSNGGATITDYKYSTNNGVTWVSAASTASPIVVTGLTNGTSYNVKLRAVNYVGDGTVSTTVAGTPITTAGAPTIGAITPASGQLSVAFTAPASNGGSTISNYQYSTNNGVTWVTRSPVSAASPIVITGLTNGTAYSVALRAVNGAGNGAVSNSANGTPGAVADAPTIGSITSGNGRLSVAFTAPTSNGGSAISDYKYSTDNGATWVSAVSVVSPIVITGLTNGTSYNVKLRAVNATGDGTASTAVSGTPAAVPGAPSITSVTAGNGQLTVAFTAPTSTGGSVITDYEYSTNNGSTWVSAGTTSTLPLVISTLTNGTSYNVKLRAVNAVGVGAASTAVSGTPVEPFFTVTYNSNSPTSGSPEKVTDTYRLSSGAVSLATVGSMTKTGYHFDGWSATVGGAQISSPYTPTANVTLYARWVGATYAITYDSNGATAGAPSVTSATYTTGGSAITVASQSTMARAGYTFNGWSSSVNDVTKKITNSGSYTISAPVILYALWTPVSYSVTYSNQNYTGGSVPIDATSYNIGNQVVVKANVNGLVRTGYSFTGWTLASDNSGTVYKSGDAYTFGAESITFYPKWSPNTYTITYAVNGATSGTPARTSDTYTTGNSAVTLSGVGTLAKFGFDFTGWSASPTGIGQATATTTANVTLYAIWSPKSITYSYALGVAGGIAVDSNRLALWPTPLTSTSTVGSTVTLSSNVDQTYSDGSSTYQFFGWRDSINGSTYSSNSNYLMNTEAGPTFTAQWIQLFAVTYAFNGGTGSAGNTGADNECNQAGGTCSDGQIITLNTAPTKVGYTFAGWKDQNGTSHLAGSSMTVRSTNFMLSAEWTQVNYSISFDSAGGSISPATQSKHYGDLATLPASGIKTGYEFSGWQLNSVMYGEGTTYSVGTTSAAFTAVWTPKKFNVSYNWNGGIGTPSDSLVYTYGDPAIVLPSGAGHLRDGYVFDGWSITDLGIKLPSSTTPASDVMYIARWVSGSFTISYDLVGGSSARTNDVVSRTSSISLPTPTRNNYVFDGWYEDSATTVLYGQAGASVTPTASKTLYAKWVQNSLSGINPAHLNPLTSITVTGQHHWSGAHTASGTGAELTIPNGALPLGTIVKVSFVEDLSRPKSLINDNFAYYTSVVLHWELGTGANATVPTAAAGKPLLLVLTNPAIRQGAKIYKIVRGVPSEVATATTDGSVEIAIYEDPEIVIAATSASAPISVSALGNMNASSTVEWAAPASTGGSSIREYTVTASPGGATCTTTSTSCTVSGLSNDLNYTFTVTATNAVGISSASSISNSVIPRLHPTYSVTFDSKGGSQVAGALFTQQSPISEPSSPTRTGFSFGGWLATDGTSSSKVSFPYSPNAANDVTLYALWTQASNPTPVVTPSPAPVESAPTATDHSSPVATGNATPAPSDSASGESSTAPKNEAKAPATTPAVGNNSTAVILMVALGAALTLVIFFLIWRRFRKN